MVMFDPPDPVARRHRAKARLPLMPHERAAVAEWLAATGASNLTAAAARLDEHLARLAGLDVDVWA